MEVIVLKDQSLFDIALQALGDISGVVLLAKLNNTSITGELIPGQKIMIPGTAINTLTRDYFKERHVIPSTGNLSGLVPRVFSREFATEFE